MGKVKEVIKAQKWFLVRMTTAYLIGHGVMSLVGSAIEGGHNRTRTRKSK